MRANPAPHKLERSHRLRDEAPFLVTHLAFAKGHRRRVKYRMSDAHEPAAGIGRLHETGLHLYRNASAGVRIERAAGHGHGDVEQGHDDPAVRHIPTVQMTRRQLQDHLRLTGGGLEKFDADVFDKRDFVPKRGGVVHDGEGSGNYERSFENDSNPRRGLGEVGAENARVAGNGALENQDRPRHGEVAEQCRARDTAPQRVTAWSECRVNRREPRSICVQHRDMMARDTFITDPVLCLP